MGEVLADMMRFYDLPLSADQALRQFRGGKMADTVVYLEAQLGHQLEDNFVPEFRALMADAFRDRLQAIDGAIDLVRSAHGKICVASSGPLEKIMLSLSLTGLLPYFEGRIFSSYEISSWKPDPGVFLHAAQSLDVEPHECAVVEDSQHGIQAGLAAGMDVFALKIEGHDLHIPPGVVSVSHLSELGPLLFPENTGAL